MNHQTINYKNHTIRAAYSNGKFWFAAIDLNQALGYKHKYSITGCKKINPAEIEMLMMPCHLGARETRVLTLNGAMELYQHNTMPETKELLQFLQTWEKSQPKQAPANQPVSQKQPIEISSNDINDLTIVILQAIVRKCESIIGQLQQA